MKDLLDQHKILKISLVVSIVVSVILILIQIVSLIVGHTLTNLEAILINILVFVFSIVFSGIFTYLGAKYSFKQSQKEFASSAYRRIKEIEAASDSLAEEIIKIDQGEDLNTNSLKVINSFLNRAISSSIEDWYQIIGKEIETIKDIEDKNAHVMQLEIMKDLILSEKESEVSKIKEINNEINALKTEIKSLKLELPQSLRSSNILTDEQIQRLRKRFSGHFAFSPEIAERNENDFRLRLQQDEIIVQIGVTSSFFEEFVGINPPTYEPNELLIIKKDKRFYYLENARGQKTRFIKTGIGAKSRKIFDEFLEENMLDLNDIHFKVVNWLPTEMTGEALLIKSPIPSISK
ncbi:hypothetical protein [Brevibacillus gelatini]